MKNVISLLLAGLLTLGLAGCGAKEEKKDTATSAKPETKQETKKEETKEENKKDEVKKSRLDGLKDAYKKAGFTVGDNEELGFQILGANNGYKFKVDNELIEIYEYDVDNLSDEGKKFIEQAKKGSVTMSGFNIPVKYKDGLMIMRYKEHSKKDKVLEVFNNYK